MSELKKVVFKLDNTEDGFFDHKTDEERKEAEELQKEQEGLFHRWGDEIVTDEETGAKLQKTVGIIEDAKGEIHKVEPEFIKFKTES